MLSKLSLEKRSYVIGLFQGDGSLSETTRNRGKFSYEISKKDEDIIWKINHLFKDYLYIRIRERVRNTNFKNNFNSIGLYISSLKFRTELKDYIPVSKKSEIIKPPINISERDYIRGLIDADGSLGLTNKGICFISFCTASEEIKNFLIKTIFKITGKKKNINRNKRDGVYNICILNEDAKIFSKYLYEDSLIYIDRKYNKYLEIMRWERDKNKLKRNQQRWSKEEDLIALNKNFSMDKKVGLLNRTKGSIHSRIWNLNTGRIKNKT